MPFSQHYPGQLPQPDREDYEPGADFDFPATRNAVTFTIMAVLKRQQTCIMAEWKLEQGQERAKRLTDAAEFIECAIDELKRTLT